MPIRLYLLIPLAAALHAEAPVASEYQVKAAYLFNFAKFVEWPARAFKTAEEPIRVCVLGQNPFGTFLEDTLRDKTVGARGFVVQDVPGAPQAAKCHILFISSSERGRLKSIFEELNGFSILTVGESDGFAGSGGMINLKLDRGRVLLEIDKEAAERAMVRISSKLLSLAQTARK